MPGLTIGDGIPNVEVDTTHGKLKINDYIKNKWAIIFSHPGDFTLQYVMELEKKGVKLLGVSCDYLSTSPAHEARFPVVPDPDGDLLRELNMVDPEQRHWSGAEQPSRALHVVGPDGRIKLCILYPASVGRRVGEVVRAVDSLQKTAAFKVATPVNWRPGEPVVISPSVPNDEADKMFPQGYRTVSLPSKKEYLRFTRV